MNYAVSYERLKRTGRYSLRWYDPVTKLRKRLLCQDRVDLIREKARITSWLAGYKGGRGSPDSIPLAVFEDYVLDMKKKGNRDSTIKMKRQHLTPYLETIFTIKQMTPESLQTFVATLSKYAIDTQAMILRDVRAFCRWTVKKKILPDNPFQDILIPVSNFVGHNLTGEELRAIYTNLPDRLRPFFVTAIDTGARRGELLGMEWNEIDLDLHFWTIPAHKCKTKIQRTIPLSDPVVQALKALPRTIHPVLYPLTKNIVQKLWQQTLKKSGITARVRIHDIRHTYASNFKGPTASLKKIAGWKSELMVSRYTHTELEYLQEEVNRTSKHLWAKFGPDVQESESRPIGD